MVEHKGGHACSSHWSHQVSKVGFLEVKCRWEQSKQQSVPGQQQERNKGLQQRGLSEAAIMNL